MQRGRDSAVCHDSNTIVCADIRIYCTWCEAPGPTRSRVHANYCAAKCRWVLGSLSISRKTTMNDIQDVRTVNEVFYRAFEKKDIELMEELWSNGSGCLCIHPGRLTLKGWENIRRSWVKIFKNVQYLEIDIDVVTIEVHHKVAYIVLKENVRQVTRGRQMVAQSMATNIFEKLGDRWYLVHHHGSPISG